MRDAIKSVFPPGAAQQSMMVSPGCGSNTDTTRPENELRINYRRQLDHLQSYLG